MAPAMLQMITFVTKRAWAPGLAGVDVGALPEPWDPGCP
jgi:hypothetical protein